MRKSSNYIICYFLVISLMMGIVFSIPVEVFAMSRATYDSKVNSFINDSRWKNGSSWNGYQGPKYSTWSSSGCYAYACDFVKFVYGKNNVQDVSAYYSIGEIRTGDVVQVDKKYNSNGELIDQGHTIVVLYRNGDKLYTAEGNYNYSSVRIKEYGYTINGSYLYDGNNKKLFTCGYHYDTIDENSSVNLSVGTGDVVDITETNAMVRGTVYNTSQVKSGMKCGVRIGTFSGNYNMTTYLEDVSQSAYNSGSEFPIWFNCNSDLGITLTKGTTYYYQMIITYGGKTYYGTEKSFKTPGTNIPMGAVDSITATGVGKVYVVGWAFDRDSLSTALDIHVYIGGPAGSSNAVCYKIGKANKTRPDLEEGYKCGSNHGFKYTILTDKSGKQPVYIYAINVGGGNENPLIGSGTVNIPADKEKPTVTKAEITSNTNGQFTVMGSATDNIQVSALDFEVLSSGTRLKTKRVAVPSGQASTTFNGSTTFNASDLSGAYKEGKPLTVVVYAVDKAGNISDKKSVNVTLKYDTQNPVVTALTALSSEPEKFTVNAAATDDSSVASMTITIWGPGQSETSGAKVIQCSSNVYNGTFSISDFKNTSGGVFNIKAVATDGYGKTSSVKTTTVNVSSKYEHTDNSENESPQTSEKPQTLPVIDTAQQVQQITSFAERMYTVVLARDAESAGLSYWATSLMNQEVDGAGIASGFINSPEFISKNLNENDYLDVLYRTFFDRDAGTDEKAYWISLMNTGMSRTEVLSNFVNSQEFSNICDSFGIARGTMQPDGSSIYRPGVRGFALRMYTKALSRNGETVGVEYWTNQLNLGLTTPEAVAKDFFFSEEYLSKNLSSADFIETLYQTFMDRESEPNGKAYWIDQLRNGMTREEALENFARCPEFNMIMMSYGL